MVNSEKCSGRDFAKRQPVIRYSSPSLTRPFGKFMWPGIEVQLDQAAVRLWGIRHKKSWEIRRSLEELG